MPGQGVRPTGSTLAICLAPLNVGTMKGHSCEIVEKLSRRRIDFCCVHESRWKGASALSNKFFWNGDDNTGNVGVGILISGKMDRSSYISQQSELPPNVTETTDWKDNSQHDLYICTPGWSTCL